MLVLAADMGSVWVRDARRLIRCMVVDGCVRGVACWCARTCMMHVHGVARMVMVVCVLLLQFLDLLL